MMPDPIAPIAAAAIEHMNSDHADAVLAYARGLAGMSLGQTSADNAPRSRWY
ncbi:MAG: hypothetical protein KatS3mg056_4035 [Chloroflexus sp.]|nr:MAG: hypothetical protein KatS3mg056_4035 [Chloroflexus sp.]